MKKILIVFLFLLANVFSSAAQTRTGGGGGGAGSVTSGAGAPSGSCTSTALYVNSSNGNLYSCNAGAWVAVSSGGSGTVTSVATTSPITGGTITTTGTVACATCTTAAASNTSGNVITGAGGQAVQDSGTALTGLANTALSNLTAVAINTALLPGTTNSIAIGSSSKEWSNLFSTAYDCGIAGTTSCVFTGHGSTSGAATITWPAVAGTTTNPVTMSNTLLGPLGSGASPTFQYNDGSGHTGGMYFSSDARPLFGNYNSFVGGFTSTGFTVINNSSIGFSSGVIDVGSDTAMSRISAGVMGFGTGSQGSVAGSISLTNITAAGLGTFSGAGAASTPSVTFTGTVFTGGSGTTTFPNVYLNYGAAPTTWLTTGTILGINGPSGFTGNYIDIHTNGGASIFSVSSNSGNILTTGSISGGTITGTNIIAGVSSALIINTRSKLTSGANGTLTATNNTGGGNMFQSDAFQSIGTTFTTTGCSVSATAGAATAGTYTSGTTGTCTVVITFGDSMTATNGWTCWANDLTTTVDTQKQTASTTTTATISGTTASGDVVNFGCMAF